MDNQEYRNKDKPEYRSKDRPEYKSNDKPEYKSNDRPEYKRTDKTVCRRHPNLRHLMSISTDRYLPSLVPGEGPDTGRRDGIMDGQIRGFHTAKHTVPLQTLPPGLLYSLSRLCWLLRPFCAKACWRR
ncbi:hypothetical protein BaRGS_00015675 [Batillaria attramentaria]|uniref:Uncharacterized protein n=1 Tax=Batillaria attramentaria TaxID=370345 RepID=A0ABD0L0X5_9CAEN